MFQKLSLLFLLSLVALTLCDPPRVRTSFEASEIRPHHLNNQLSLNEEDLDSYYQNNEDGNIPWNVEDYHQTQDDNIVAFTSDVDNFDVAVYEPLSEDNSAQNTQVNQNVDATPEINYGTVEPSVVIRSADEAYDAVREANVHFNSQVDESQVSSSNLNADDNLRVYDAGDIAAFTADSTPANNNQDNTPTVSASTNVPSDIPPINSTPEITAANSEANPEPTVAATNNLTGEDLSFDSDLWLPNQNFNKDNQPEDLPPVSAYPNIVTRTARASYDAINAANEVVQIQNNNLAGLYDDLKNPIQDAPTLAATEAYSKYTSEVNKDLGNLRGANRL